MTALVPLYDGDHVAQLDVDVAARLDGYELRLLGGRVIAIRDNQFHDLPTLIAGPGAVSLHGNPYDLRRASLGTLHYTLDQHGDLALREAQPDASRLAAALVPPAGGPPPHAEPQRLSSGGRLAFLPFECARKVANISADSIHNSATRLTLSHWPQNRTPERFRANLSTESAMMFIDEPGTLDATGVRHVTTDHVDLDGIASVYTLMSPDHARRHRAALVAISRFGDFARGRDDDARRLAFALNTLIARASPQGSPDAPVDATTRIAAVFRMLLPALRDLLDARSIPEAMWRDAEQHHTESEALLDHPATRIESYPQHDLAVFHLPDSSRLLGGAKQRYFGLSPISFHNRTSFSTIAIVALGEVVIHQRYESWVERVSAAPPPRRDLSILARALDAAETNGSCWQYDGVQHIMPRLGRTTSRPGRLSAELVIRELQRVIEIAPAAWLATPAAGDTARMLPGANETRHRQHA